MRQIRDPILSLYDPVRAFEGSVGLTYDPVFTDIAFCDGVADIVLELGKNLIRIHRFGRGLLPLNV